MAMLAMAMAGSDQGSLPAAPGGLATVRLGRDLGGRQRGDDQAVHGGAQQRREGVEAGGELGPQPITEQVSDLLPGPGDERDVAGLGVRERHLDLVAELPVGEARERRVQGEVGPPLGRGEDALEVQQGQLADQLEDQACGAVAAFPASPGARSGPA
jgi:hypothetical protein